MFEQLEYEIMSLISKELPEIQNMIINQYINCNKRREFTGHGFFTYFSDIMEKYVISRHSSEQLGKPAAVLNESCTVGFVLFMKDGKITCLEGYTFGDPWPKKIYTYDIIQ